MFCTECGKEIPDSSEFCPECGQKLHAAQESAGAVSSAPLPSLYKLCCPSCGSSMLQALGEKGSVAKSMGTYLAFGAIGNMVASSRASKNAETPPIQYKCTACKNKFVSAPLQAQADELLAAPCTINFQRLSSFVGAAIAEIVYLNGEKIGPVKSGKSLTFQTGVRYNTIFVTDPHGVAFQDMYRFEAQPGGTVEVRFNRKFQ